MKLVHLVAPAAVGGLERVLLSLAAGQRARGLDVCVATLLAEGQTPPPLLDQLRDAGVSVAPILTKGRDYLGQIRQVRAVCQTHGALVLHTHGYLADLVGLMAARQNGPALVTTVHGFTANSRRTRVYEWIDRRAFRRFDAVVAVSRKLSDDLARAGVPQSRIRTIVNAWSATTSFESASAARAMLQVPPGVFTIGWIGRITVEKGLDVMVDALGLLRDLDVRLAVVGDGADRTQVSQRAAAAGVNDRIKWLGTMPNAARLLQGMDALVISSRTEGTPMTLLEAMEAGTPVVATAVGGIPDVISPRHGLVVPPENPEALAAAIRSVHDDPSAAVGRAQAARQRLISEFALDPWLDQYEQLYRSLRTQSTP